MKIIVNSKLGAASKCELSRVVCFILFPFCFQSVCFGSQLGLHCPVVCQPFACFCVCVSLTVCFASYPLPHMFSMFLHVCVRLSDGGYNRYHLL